MSSYSRRSKRRKLISEINVVPYIDVMLALLIIFMMTAPLQQNAIDVNLPTATGSKIDRKDQSALIISIQKDGQYYLTEKEDSEKSILLAELLSKLSTLQKNNPQTQVYIRADKALDYGKIILVMAALKEAGVSHVGLITSSTALEP